MNHWRPRKRRHFGSTKQKKILYDCLILLAGVVALISIIHIVSYHGQKRNDQQSTEELNEIMEAATTIPIVEEPTAKPIITPTPTDMPSKLLVVAYEKKDNDARIEGIKALSEQHEDIIGWIKIEGMLDEAVVQRDNEYYLDHDATGKKNINGALFLDAIVDLSTRPYSLVIYGHNMRSGAKFGNLYKYEDERFLTSHRRISFDTIHEAGTYEIFAAGVFDTSELDIFFLNTLDVRRRMEMIEKVREIASVDTGIDVSLADQLLFLITCVDDDQDRRFVVAKRVE